MNPISAIFTFLLTVAALAYLTPSMISIDRWSMVRVLLVILLALIIYRVLFRDKIRIKVKKKRKKKKKESS